MVNYDVFNGDADGICALLQLRLAEPKESQLITGVKRDINLLRRVQANTGDCITVLDISMAKNQTDLQRLLNAGAEVFYVDHHFAGDVPSSAALKTLINEAPDVCTSLLVNHYLRGAYVTWGIVGTFGDNLKKSAMGMAKNIDLSAKQLQQLEELGTYLNYNGYGSALADLHFDPADLYLLASEYASAQAGNTRLSLLARQYPICGTSWWSSREYRLCSGGVSSTLILPAFFSLLVKDITDLAVGVQSAPAGQGLQQKSGTLPVKQCI